MKKVFKSVGTIQKFPQKGGWVYLPIQQTYADLDIPKPRWGLVPATKTLGRTTWKRSLLPMGDGTLFIALNEKVQRAEKLRVGDKVTVTFTV